MIDGGIMKKGEGHFTKLFAEHNDCDKKHTGELYNALTTWNVVQIFIEFVASGAYTRTVCYFVRRFRAGIPTTSELAILSVIVPRESPNCVFIFFCFVLKPFVIFV